jgi:hypothetical protein
MVPGRHRGEAARFTVSSGTRIWRAQSGGPLFGVGLDQHPHNVALFHYEVLDTIDFDLGAGQDAVADLDVDRDELAALVSAAGSNGDDLALLRLLLGGVGNDYASSGRRLGVDSLDDNSVVKRSEFHCCPPTVLSKSGGFGTLIVISKVIFRGPDISGPLRSRGLIECRRHACLDWLGSLNRDLLSKRANLLILPGNDFELFPHVRRQQLDEFRRGLHTQQLMGVVKGGASVGTGNLDKLEIVVCGALGNGRIGVFEQIG